MDEYFPFLSFTKEGFDKFRGFLPFSRKKPNDNRSIAHSRRESNSIYFFVVDFDHSTLESIILSEISEQSSIGSAEFDEDFETGFISPSEIVGMCLASTRNIRCLELNDSSIESMLDFFGKKIDAELSSFRVANSNFSHSEKFGDSIEALSS